MSQLMTLTNKQKQYLKGLAHSLKPVVQLGNNGLTVGVIAEIENALKHHELIKVKIPSDDRDEKALIMDAIIGETKSHKVQNIGHTLVLYKPNEDPQKESQISLPKK